MSTVAFHTLGCIVNHYETEAIWQLLIGKIIKVKLCKAGYPYNEGQFVRVLDELALT